MIKFILIPGLFLFMAYQALSQQWGTVGYVPSAVRYDDIYFVDSLIGWTVNSNGGIYKTINGGRSWEESFMADDYFRSIEFLDEKIGFAGSLSGHLIRTDDGGVTWTEVQDKIPHTIRGICGLSHIGNNVYGVGIWQYPAYFIKSEDQGITWSYTDLSGYAKGLVDCYFLDENIGFVSGVNSGGVILKTTDGGETWHEVHHTPRSMEYVWKIFFVDDSIAYASIESFGDTTSILKTTDSGNTWLELEVSPLGLDIQGIGFINENRGWVSPRFAPILETNDGGHTWVTLSDMGNINRFFKVNDQTMYASGSTIYKFYNGIAHNMNPDTTHVHDILLVKPNPFSEEVTVQIKIDRDTYVKLDIISENGSVVIPVQDGLLNKGIHLFQLDKKDLAPLKNGLAIVALRTNEGFLAKQMIKADH
jgi:photosystem II stability/assembly factor-like uncharacterized protein